LADEDTRLVASAQAGDRQALATLVERHYAALRATLIRYGGARPDEVEDLLQETFLRALTAMGRFENRGHLRAWLFRIALNLTRDARKRERRVFTAFDAATLADVPDFAADPERTVLGRLDGETLQAALARLPESHREVLVLRFYADLPVEEVARIMGCPQGTVKSRIHYGVRKLRGLLSVEAGGGVRAVSGNREQTERDGDSCEANRKV
jgi:RNA polymerase sigma-70 factor (ECF subfamily)